MHFSSSNMKLTSLALQSVFWNRSLAFCISFMGFDVLWYCTSHATVLMTITCLLIIFSIAVLMIIMLLLLYFSVITLIIIMILLHLVMLISKMFLLLYFSITILMIIMFCYCMLGHGKSCGNVCCQWRPQEVSQNFTWSIYRRGSSLGRT